MHKEKIVKILELFPLLAFFIGYKFSGIILGTAAMILATIFHIFISYRFNKKINKVALISIILLSISFLLTLISGNAMFIKIKPTILYIIFALIFFITTYYTKKPAIKYVFANVFDLKDEKCWKQVNIRFAYFFLFMAILNEVIWRNFTESFWVNFKVFGALPITIIFTFSQLPFLIKNKKEQELVLTK